MGGHMVKDSRILDVRVLKLYRTRIGAASTLEPLHPRLQKGPPHHRLRSVKQRWSGVSVLNQKA